MTDDTYTAVLSDMGEDEAGCQRRCTWRRMGQPPWRALAAGLVALLPLVLHAQEWDSPANIKAAVQAFLDLQSSQGNEAVVRQTQQCYSAVRTLGPSQALEYCIAFDAANIEMTTFFYESLCQQYKSSKAVNLQPPETTRVIGQKRIATQAARARLSNPVEFWQTTYAKTIRAFAEMSNATAQPSQP